MADLQCPQAFQCIELFAGDGSLGRSARYGLVATAQLELAYGEDQANGRLHKQNAFDFTTPAGLALLSCEVSRGVFLLLATRATQVGCVGRFER